jgi:hypothetical protein
MLPPQHSLLELQESPLCLQWLVDPPPPPPVLPSPHFSSLWSLWIVFVDASDGHEHVSRVAIFGIPSGLPWQLPQTSIVPDIVQSLHDSANEPGGTVWLQPLAVADDASELQAARPTPRERAKAVMARRATVERSSMARPHRSDRAACIYAESHGAPATNARRERAATTGRRRALLRGSA